MKPIRCPGTDPGPRDLAPLYLAGRLTEEEAEAFETHYLGCPKCREDVRGGAALRELYGKAGVAAASARQVSARRSWLPLAAAAAIAFAGVGVWQAARRGPAPSDNPAVLRGASRSMNVRLAPAASGGVEAEWTAPPGAASYTARVFARDGAELWKSETRAPRVGIDPAILSSRGTEVSLLFEVEALDARGRVVASSNPVPIPGR